MTSQAIINKSKSTVRSGLKFIKTIMKREEIGAYLKQSQDYGELWR